METAMRAMRDLIEEEEQRAAAPVLPEMAPFADIPRPIWTAFLSIWALVFGMFVLFFTKDGPATLAVLTAAFFALMTLGLPAVLSGRPARSSRLPRIIGTRNGPLPVGAAATQILLIPAGTLIGLTAFVILVL
jgi:hypothetical protein